MAKVTREKFAKRYAESSNIEWDEFKKLDFYVARCRCDAPNCEGWQMQHRKTVERWRTFPLDPEHETEVFAVSEME
jgi:hypothetical protein